MTISSALADRSLVVHLASESVAGCAVERRGASTRRLVLRPMWVDMLVGIGGVYRERDGCSVCRIKQAGYEVGVGSWGRSITRCTFWHEYKHSTLLVMSHGSKCKQGQHSLPIHVHHRPCRVRDADVLPGGSTSPCICLLPQPGRADCDYTITNSDIATCRARQASSLLRPPPRCHHEQQRRSATATTMTMPTSARLEDEPASHWHLAIWTNMG